MKTTVCIYSSLWCYAIFIRDVENVDMRVTLRKSNAQMKLVRLFLRVCEGLG